MSMVITKFTKERETKNTVRYAEQGDESGHKIGVLYVKKSTLERFGNPGTLEVWIGPEQETDE